jgi:hypothetical protein
VRYQIKDSGADALDVQTNEELVSLLRETIAYVPAATNYEFMVEMAHQIKLQSGDVVRTGKVDEFIEDLLEIGFIKTVTGNEDKSEKK